jgi:hypothetical protein
MFELNHQAATLTNFNPRRELHGEEAKPAADLKFSANIESSLLAMLDPWLRPMLYHKRDSASHDLADATHEAPNLRFPKLGPLSWNSELVGATLTIHRGIGESSDLRFPLCAVNQFKLEPQEGGTCVLTWRVQCHPDEAQSGKLAFMIAESCDVTIEPPGDDEPAPELPAGGSE